MDYSVESIKIVAAFSSCQGGAPPIVFNSVLNRE